jgi:hypothetical protein
MPWQLADVADGAAALASVAWCRSISSTSLGAVPGASLVQVVKLTLPAGQVGCHAAQPGGPGFPQVSGGLRSDGGG